MDLLRRAYWMVIEVFLSVTFLTILIAAVLAASGLISLDREQPVQGGRGNSAAHRASP
jgi:hypothetical protein